MPDDRAVGGLLQPGASVDVFVTSTIAVPEDVAAAGKYFSDKSTKIVYQNMLILAKTATAYVLKASIPVAEEISHLQASGTAAFSFALRPGQDLRDVDTSTLGTTTTKIVARYGLPLPEWYGPGKAPAPVARSPAGPEPSSPASSQRRARHLGTPRSAIGPCRLASAGRVGDGDQLLRRDRSPDVSTTTTPGSARSRSTRPPWAAIRRSASAGAIPRPASRPAGPPGRRSTSQTSSQSAA